MFMKNDLRDVVTAIEVARKIYWRVKLNFMWALLYNCIGILPATHCADCCLGIPIAAGVLYPGLHATLRPEWAGLGEALSSVSVIVSSLLLRLYRAPVL